jgi:hypothetical protein
MFRVFDGKAFGRGLDGAFGCAVPYDVGTGTRRGRAAEVYEAAALLGDEVRHDHFAAVEEGFHVDADEAVEFSFVDFMARWKLGC